MLSGQQAHGKLRSQFAIKELSSLFSAVTYYLDRPAEVARFLSISLR